MTAGLKLARAGERNGGSFGDKFLFSEVGGRESVSTSPNTMTVVESEPIRG